VPHKPLLGSIYFCSFVLLCKIEQSNQFPITE
jgi:hypothetical protein